MMYFGSNVGRGSADWINGDTANNLLTVVSDPVAGDVGLFTSTAAAPISSGVTEGRSIKITPDQWEYARGSNIVITIRAKRPATNAATQFSAAYSLNSVGNSAWQSFTPTTSWALYTFSFAIEEDDSNDDYIGIWADTAGAGNGVLISDVWVSSDNAMTKGLGVKIYSLTGALVADYYSNTKTNDGLSIRVTEMKEGGLDSAKIKLTNNILDPLFTDMECQIFVDGEHWFSCFVETLPEADNTEASITLLGKGFWHKLKTVIVNESYTSQTLDYIVKDIASTYLSADLNVLYDVSKIIVPTVAGITLEFKDKPLHRVLGTLLDICNVDFQNNQYRAFVDKDKYLNFTLLSFDILGAYFEGYHYQDPEVETVKDKMVNRILTYRTISGNDNEVEYVATYSDSDSIANYGLAEKKMTLSDYMITAGVEDIATGIIERFKEPLTRVVAKNMIVDAVQDFGTYRLSNQRKLFLKTVSSLETLTGWDVSNLLNTTASITGDHVFTNRKSLKMVNAVGSQNDRMFYELPSPIYFPQELKFYSYRTNASAKYTLNLSDTFGNLISIPVGHNNEPINEWVKYTVRIDIELATGTLIVDFDATNSGPLILDLTPTISGTGKVDFLLSDGVLNLTQIEIYVDSDIATTSYFDQIDTTVAAFNTHELVLEEISYTLDNSYTADQIYGDRVDSIIEEIMAGNTDGQSALSIFSKQ